MTASDPLAGREVIFEFTVVGTMVRVCAIDTLSGTEATIIGPANESRQALERVALQKLRYVLTKRRE